MKKSDLYSSKVIELLEAGWSITYSKNKAAKDLKLSYYEAEKVLKNRPELEDKINKIKLEKNLYRKYAHNRFL